MNRPFRSPRLSSPVSPALPAAHPEVHAYRNWRGQIVCHHHVDVTTIVEISTPQRLFPLVHVFHDADIRDVVDLTAELHGVRSDPTATRSGRWLARAASVGARVPGVIPAMYVLMGRSVRTRQRSGTVAVTAVGMFAGGGGFGIAPMTLNVTPSRCGRGYRATAGHRRTSRGPRRARSHRHNRSQRRRWSPCSPFRCGAPATD
jgi:hypothetical protein